MTIKTRPIEYQDEDDTLEACLAWDDAVEGTRPGILIAHTWAGRGDFEDAKARDLAALGYAGFALDLYGKGVRGSGPDRVRAPDPPLHGRPCKAAAPDGACAGHAARTGGRRP